MAQLINRPVAFQGAPDEAEENFQTHDWGRVDVDEVRCFACDAKPWHAAAKYPCLSPPPRETVIIEDDGTTRIEPTEYGADLF